MYVVIKRVHCTLILALLYSAVLSARGLIKKFRIGPITGPGAAVLSRDRRLRPIQQSRTCHWANDKVLGMAILLINVIDIG